MFRFVRFLLVVSSLAGCAAGRDLPFFTPDYNYSPAAVDVQLWWGGGRAPREVVVDLPDRRLNMDYVTRGNFIYKRGIVNRPSSIQSPLRGKRLAVLADYPLVIDDTAYVRAHPGAAGVVAKWKNPNALMVTPDVDMLIRDVGLQFIGATGEDRIYGAPAQSASPRMGLESLLKAEPLGDYVLDQGIELVRLREDGMLDIRLRYRLADRAKQRWVSEHICTATTYRPLVESDLGSARYNTVSGMVYAVRRICEEAGRRDFVFGEL